MRKNKDIEYEKKVAKSFHVGITRGNNYYIANTYEFMYDKNMSEFFNMDYPKEMRRKFNAKATNIGEIMFENRNDAEKALEYINSLALLICLE